MPDHKFAVITGNPIDGIFLYGPFPTAEAATRWAEREQGGESWWVAPIRNNAQYQRALAG